MKIDRIFVSKIDPEVLTFQGFDQVGCFGCGCADACCGHGCDVDKGSYALVYLHRDIIEHILQTSVDDCFTHRWAGEPDFLGGDGTRSAVIGRFCAFHMRTGKGCALYHAALSFGLPRRIIPSICRLYPLSWRSEGLCLCGDLHEECNCLHNNKDHRSVIESQWDSIVDIFEFSEDVRVALAQHMTGSR